MSLNAAPNYSTDIKMTVNSAYCNVFDNDEIENSYCHDEVGIWKKVKTHLSNFPDEKQELMPGVRWGDSLQLYTPAFWKLQYIIYDQQFPITNHKFSNTIIEEIVACLLGGFGLKSEIGLLAFKRLKETDLIKPGMKYDAILQALLTPFKMPSGKLNRYRFYNQKAKFLSQFLNRNDLEKIDNFNDIELRDWLISVNGIGPKTASWITRNWLDSKQVAILDIHLLRAGQLAGFFGKKFNVTTDYFKMEKSYLHFCEALEVCPATMDAIIWGYMKKSNKLALTILQYK